MLPPTVEWVISDTHFNHNKIKTYCNRPDDFTERIIRNWQRLVRPQDIVFHLGDVIIGAKSDLKGIMEQLPGVKVLIMGNHDTETPTWYMRNGFHVACESMVYKRVLMTHTPAQSLPDNAFLNIFGHFHNNPPERWEYKVHPWNKLFAVEHTKYEPVMFSKFVGPIPTDIFERKYQDMILERDSQCQPAIQS